MYTYIYIHCDEIQSNHTDNLTNEPLVRPFVDVENIKDLIDTNQI